MKKFVIIGSALSGNKGAAAMLESSLQTLQPRYPDAEFTLLSMYPEEDKLLNTYKNLTILPATPLFVGLVLNPAAVLYKCIPPLRNFLLAKVPQLDAIKKADALLDQGGITFTDGREIFLLYNVASILPALLVRTKVIKCAQALGPFQNPINRFVSKLILPRIALIIARGQITYEYLQQLRLKNVVLATDYAFSLEITSDELIAAEKMYASFVGKMNLKNKENVGISPSVVVQKKCEKKGINYVDLMAWFINDLISQGYVVTLIPHSVRSGNSGTHNNDMPLCQEIFQKIKQKDNCIFINQEVNSQVLRYIIGKTDLFIACRFHAMISALAMGVPTLVLGWSHKYSEILNIFGVKEFGLDASKLSQQSLTHSFEKLMKNKVDIKKKLKKNLPAVKTLSLTHVELISKVVD